MVILLLYFVFRTIYAIPVIQIRIISPQLLVKLLMVHHK